MVDVSRFSEVPLNENRLGIQKIHELQDFPWEIICIFSIMLLVYWRVLKNLWIETTAWTHHLPAVPGLLHIVYVLQIRLKLLSSLQTLQGEL